MLTTTRAAREALRRGLGLTPARRLSGTTGGASGAPVKPKDGRRQAEEMTPEQIEELSVFRAVAAALDESAADALEASIPSMPSPPNDAARARRRMAAEGEALARTLHRLRLGDDDASGDDQDANASGTGSGSESESAPRLAAFARRAREE